MTDPLADMLTRIRNAYMANKDQVDIPFSSIKQQLAQKLDELDYIESFKHQADQNLLTLKLKYINQTPVITSIKRISKPGRRVYIRSGKITPTLSGHGAKILTTSRGVLTDTEARQAGIGGEIICEVY